MSPTIGYDELRAATSPPDLEFTGPVCNLRDIDLGIAVGSAAKIAAIHSIDCRCQTRVATAARKLALIQADHAAAHLELPPTGTQPVGIPGATRHGGARNRQAPRPPSRPSPTSSP